jgi:hypothetical protein
MDWTSNSNNRPPPPLFARSPIDIVNDHNFENVPYHLAKDGCNFHVFIIVILPGMVRVRIDWNRESTLTFTPYAPKQGGQTYALGYGYFCKHCIEQTLLASVDSYPRYNLFEFNCRSVAFLVLNSVGFEYAHVYSAFREMNVLGGIEMHECFTPEAMRAYLCWQEKQNGCVIS